MGTQAHPDLRFPQVQLPHQHSVSVFMGGTGFEAVLVRGGQRIHDAHMLKLSPQPHVPLMLGLLKTNSQDSFDSTKSISVPRRVS